MILGIGAGYILTSLPILQSEPTLISTCIAGAVGIIAMILPGISGSYILLIINHYYYVLDIVHQYSDGIKTIISE